MSTKKIDTVRNTDQLAAMLSLPTYDEVYERNIDYVMETVYHAICEARAEHESDFENHRADDLWSDEQEETVREAAETEVTTDLYRDWHAGVLGAVESLLGEHCLQVTAVRPDEKTPYEWRVAPADGHTWRDACRAILDTMNGVGYFYFASVREFCDSGPYTPKEAVMSHLGYVRQRPEVYGSASARTLYEGAWR